MVGDKTKKLKIAENLEDTIDEKLILSIEKLQEVQDELDKVSSFPIPPHLSTLSAHSSIEFIFSSFLGFHSPF